MDLVSEKNGRRAGRWGGWTGSASFSRGRRRHHLKKKKKGKEREKADFLKTQKKVKERRYAETETPHRPRGKKVGENGRKPSPALKDMTMRGERRKRAKSAMRSPS